MKKRTLASAILLLIIFLPIGSYNAYVYAGEQTRYSAISSHLLSERGYNQEDIRSINIEYCLSCVFLSYEPWIITVVYEDEPEAIYYYHVSNGNVTQGGLSGSTPDEQYHHLEDAPADIKKR